MGTRSLTIVRNEQEEHLVTIYRQFDGYPEGHGAELLGFLHSGIPGKESRLMDNGFEELAARLVFHLKEDNPNGNIYIYPAGSSNVGEEFVYEVGPMLDDPTTVRLIVRERISFFGGEPEMKVLYDGPVAGFADWLESKGE